MEPIIKLEDLTFIYPEAERPAVDGVTLEFERGSFVAVLGHNGSYKNCG